MTAASAPATLLITIIGIVAAAVVVRLRAAKSASAPAPQSAPGHELMRADGVAEALRLGLTTDSAALLVTVVVSVAAVGVVWLRAVVSAAAPGPEAPSSWSAPETSPLARRACLELCSSGAGRGKKVGRGRRGVTKMRTPFANRRGWRRSRAVREQADLCAQNGPGRDVDGATRHAPRSPRCPRGSERIDVVTNAAVMRLRAIGAADASRSEAVPTWGAKYITPLARWTHRELRRSGAEESRRPEVGHV